MLITFLLCAGVDQVVFSPPLSDPPSVSVTKAAASNRLTWNRCSLLESSPRPAAVREPPISKCQYVLHPIIPPHYLCLATVSNWPNVCTPLLIFCNVYKLSKWVEEKIHLIGSKRPVKKFGRSMRKNVIYVSALWKISVNERRFKWPLPSSEMKD